MRVIAAALSAFAMTVLGSEHTQAHPHMYTQVRTQILFNGEKAIIGVGQVWVFDEFYSQFALEGIDSNNDGKFDAAELAGLATTNMQQMKDVGYFTEADIEGSAVQFALPIEPLVQRDDKGILTLSFILPTAQPLHPGTLKFNLKVYDPEYYIGFSFSNQSPVTLGPGAPAACKALVIKADPEGAVNSVSYGGTFADAVAVTCAG